MAKALKISVFSRTIMENDGWITDDYSAIRMDMLSAVDIAKLRARDDGTRTGAPNILAVVESACKLSTIPVEDTGIIRESAGIRARILISPDCCSSAALANEAYFATIGDTINGGDWYAEPSNEGAGRLALARKAPLAYRVDGEIVATLSPVRGYGVAGALARLQNIINSDADEDNGN